MKLSKSLGTATESPICRAWIPLPNARFAHTHYLLETLHHKWRVSVCSNFIKFGSMYKQYPIYLHLDTDILSWSFWRMNILTLKIAKIVTIS